MTAVPARAPDADRAGVLASTLCAAHCFANGALAGVSGVAPILADRRIELGLTASAISLAVLALLSSYRRHHCRRPVAVGALGVVSLSFARLPNLDPKALETALSITGGALLVLAHLINLRERRRVDSCCSTAGIPHERES